MDSRDTDKEKLVRDLVSTLYPGSELHEYYKSRMKQIILVAFVELGKEDENASINLEKWIDDFVEARFNRAFGEKTKQ